MTEISPGRLRAATAADRDRLLHLWDLLFSDDGTLAGRARKGAASEWFTRYADDSGFWARFPVIEVDGELVATAVGTLEIGVPNPQCVRGRTVRLANVITFPRYRGARHGTRLVLDVVAWARVDRG